METIKGFTDLDLKLLLFSHFGTTEKVNQTLNMGIDWLMKWKESVSEMMSEDISLGGVIEKFRADI